MSGSTALEATEERETALVEAIARGCRESESLFVARYMPRVRTLLLIRSRDPDLAGDLQQEVMIAALCALRKGQLRDAERLPAFVAGIARNLLNSHYRERGRMPAQEELPEEIPDLSDERSQETEAAQERRGIAHRAIASLDSLDRSILQMTLVEDLKPGVIAERLGLKPDVVRQRKLRATRRVMETVRHLSLPLPRRASLSQNPNPTHIAAGESE